MNSYATKGMFVCAYASIFLGIIAVATFTTKRYHAPYTVEDGDTSIIVMDKSAAEVREIVTINQTVYEACTPERKREVIQFLQEWAHSAESVLDMQDATAVRQVELQTNGTVTSSPIYEGPSTRMRPNPQDDPGLYAPPPFIFP